MSKINVTQFKNGNTFIHENEPYIVLETSHSQAGRGQAKVKAKVKNLMNGTTTYITYTGGTMVDKAFVEKNEMQYLYAEQTTIVLMDTTSFEQIEIPLANVKDELPFLIGGSNIMVTTFEGQVLGVELDKNVTLTVTEAPDAVQGNTVTNALKKITLETGLEIDAPQFIKPGDKVVVSTTDKKYVGKA